MTVSNTSLAAVQVAGDKGETLGQKQVALAREGFREKKTNLWRQYSGEVDQAKAPLIQALEERAVERLALKAVGEINQTVGGGIDVENETATVKTVISQALRAHVETRSQAIKLQREENNATVIDAAVSGIEAKVTELLQNTSTEPKKVNADLLKQLISLVIQADKSGELLKPEVLAVYGSNADQAVDSLAQKVLVKFKPRAAEPAQA